MKYPKISETSELDEAHDGLEEKRVQKTKPEQPEGVGYLPEQLILLDIDKRLDKHYNSEIPEIDHNLEVYQSDHKGQNTDKLIKSYQAYIKSFKEFKEAVEKTLVKAG